MPTAAKPKQDPAPPEATKPPPEATKPPEAPAAPSFIAQIVAKDEADRSPAERQIIRALTLEKERSEHQTKVSKNRDYLRLMDANEELTAEQGEWLDAFYPLKEKGEQRSKDEIERTRKAKEEARSI